MVKLNKIYTRTGDNGMTSLVGGQRVSKHARRPAAFGEVDELNSVIGLARCHAKGEFDEMLARIQNDLFDLGADLATSDNDQPALRITDGQVTRIEAEIDKINENLDALTSFVFRRHRACRMASSGTDSRPQSRAPDDRTGRRRTG